MKQEVKDQIKSTIKRENKMNRMEKLLQKAEEQGKLTMTCRELFDFQEVSAIQDNKILDPITLKILKDHGYTLEKWREEVLLPGTRFWWGPNKEQAEINNKIKAALKKQLGFLPAQVLYSYSLFSGQLSSLMTNKSKTISRRKNNKDIYEYYLI